MARAALDDGGWPTDLPRHEALKEAHVECSPQMTSCQSQGAHGIRHLLGQQCFSEVLDALHQFETPRTATLNGKEAPRG